MINYRFNAQDLIEASKNVRDEFGFSVYDDISGIAAKVYPEMPYDRRIERVAEHLIKRSNLHKHGSRKRNNSNVIHFSLKGVSVSLDDKTLGLGNQELDKDLNVESFARAFKAYQREIAFRYRAYPPSASWDGMQSFLAGLLR